MLKWRNHDFAEEFQIDRTDLIYREFDYTVGNPMSKIWLGNVFQDPGDFLNIYDQVTARKIEGAILKHRNGLYVPGGRPNKTWYKIKRDQEFDVVVMGYTEGNGKYDGMVGAIEFGTFHEGEFVRVGRCSGMTMAERQDITDHKDEYLGRVFVVKSNDLVGSGEYKTPRHPNFLYFRDDKLATDCSRDQFHEENV